MVDMKERELEKWEETRSKGKWKFIFDNSFFALIFAFLVFFLGNAYENRHQLELYFDSFFHRIWHNLLVLVIAFIGLIIVSFIIWIINERRYIKAKNSGNTVENKETEEK